MTRQEVIELNKKNVDITLSKKGYGRTYVARKVFYPGDTVMAGFGKKIDHQTNHISVQIKINNHYLPGKWTSRYWNHSCDPNTYIQTRLDGFPNLLALKRINIGDEITYSYWMTEFKWIKGADENHVMCKCGQQKCRKNILSFSQLTTIEKNKLIKSRMCSKYLWYYKQYKHV